jgi:DNA-directed RNA polymerase subunit RPC12/RpoP
MEPIKFHCLHCGQKIEVDEEFEGEIANCPSCHEEIVIAREDENILGERRIRNLKIDKTVHVNIDSATNNHAKNENGELNLHHSCNTVNYHDNNNSHKGKFMKEYKVLTPKDKWFSGKFDPNNLEKAINAYAQQGWRVVSAATAIFPGLIGGHRKEMVVILERDK